MTGPHQLCYVNCGLPADECSCYRDIMSRAGDPAVLAALPEVQALIAAAYEVAAVASMSYGPSYYMTQGGSGFQETHTKLGAFAFRTDIRDAIRALTPADATAALAARDAAMRAQGLREAAEWYRVAGWKLDEDDVPDAILARAAGIEKDGK